MRTGRFAIDRPVAVASPVLVATRPAPAPIFAFVRAATRLLLVEPLPDLVPSLATTSALAVGAAPRGAVIPAALVRESRLFALFKARA